MVRVVERRTRDWAERGEVDLYEESRQITFDVAAEALVGMEGGPVVDRLRHLFAEMLHGDPDPMAETYDEFMARIMRARAELDEMLLRLIGERRANPTDDILGMLVAARDEEGRALTDLELLGQVHILLVAGHETTTTNTAWLLYLLATHPEYLSRVLDEIDAELGTEGEIDLKAIRGLQTLSNAMDEAGRLYPPVLSLPREVMRDVVFAGYRLPAGTQIRLVVGATHRLPHIFAEPERFDPDRFAPPRREARETPYALSTFGGGPRICIGINFAQIEMRIAAAHILRQFTLEPIPDRPVTHRYYGITASIPGGIHVQVKPRRAA
jgi:cytochrome P450